MKSAFFNSITKEVKDRPQEGNNELHRFICFDNIKNTAGLPIGGEIKNKIRKPIYFLFAIFERAQPLKAARIC